MKTYMETIDWNRTYEVEQFGTGHYYVKYELPTDLTETEVRENMLYWEWENIWSLFKVYTISPDLMRQIQVNLSRDDLKQFEHEILLDCTIPRQCFPEQLSNYITYMENCKIYFEDELNDKHNVQKLKDRIERMSSSFSYNGEIASFVDFDGSIIDQQIF